MPKSELMAAYRKDSSSSVSTTVAKGDTENNSDCGHNDYSGTLGNSDNNTSSGNCNSNNNNNNNNIPNNNHSGNSGNGSSSNCNSSGNNNSNNKSNNSSSNSNNNSNNSSSNQYDNCNANENGNNNFLLNSTSPHHFMLNSGSDVKFSPPSHLLSPRSNSSTTTTSGGGENVSGSGGSKSAATGSTPTRRRVRRRATSSSDPAEQLTEMSVRGLNLFRYACIDDGVYKCLECAKTDIVKTFKNKYSFQRHAFLYHEGCQRKVFPCLVCSKEFSRPDKMKNHMKTVHDCFMPKECVVPKECLFPPPPPIPFFLSPP